jgi:prepilin-type N-terminal cleavage/methylation domain-containing protein
MKLSDRGFTLVEICVALGLGSVLALILSEMSMLSARSTQSSNAADEFNSDVALLLNLINSSNFVQGGTNGCTMAFQGLPLMPLPAPNNTVSVPQLSPALPLPAPSPSSSFVAYISASPLPSPVAIFTQPSASPNPLGAIVQVSVPSAQTANSSFPAPRNNLWVTNLYFNAVIDTNFIPPSGPTSQSNSWVSNLYQLHLDAQKVIAGQALLGGETTYSKDFLVLLWVGGTPLAVQYCGPNPP